MENFIESLNMTEGTIGAALLKCNLVLKQHKRVAVSISGGSDSDIMLDMIERCRRDEMVDCEIRYFWCDTGLEYQATKDHLVYLEQRYGITIERVKAQKPIPLCVKQYGVPFVSKYVAEYLHRLQIHDFGWEDLPLDELKEKYPNVCRQDSHWWCNQGTFHQYRIDYNKWLKEFLVENKLDIPISAVCCDYSKKKPAKKFCKDMNADLQCVGVRKAEGGVRAASYKNCFTDYGDPSKMNQFRPVWYLTDDDKRDYEQMFNIVHSRCYTEYGLRRTGCVGCPFNRNAEQEMKIVEKYEPKLYAACQKIFGGGYELTRKYRQFAAAKNEEQKKDTNQIYFN